MCDTIRENLGYLRKKEDTFTELSPFFDVHSEVSGARRRYYRLGSLFAKLNSALKISYRY